MLAGNSIKNHLKILSPGWNPNLCQYVGDHPLHKYLFRFISQTQILFLDFLSDKLWSRIRAQLCRYIKYLKSLGSNVFVEGLGHCFLELGQSNQNSNWKIRGAWQPGWKMSRTFKTDENFNSWRTNWFPCCSKFIHTTSQDIQNMVNKLSVLQVTTVKLGALRRVKTRKIDGGLRNKTIGVVEQPLQHGTL